MGKIDIKTSAPMRALATAKTKYPDFFKAGRWEGLVHFDTRTMEPKGGTITYTLLEW